MPPHGLLTSFLSLTPPTILPATLTTSKATDASVVKAAIFTILPWPSMPPFKRAFTTLPPRSEVTPLTLTNLPTDSPEEISAAGSKPKAPPPPKDQPEKKIRGVGIGDSGGPGGDEGTNINKEVGEDSEGTISGEEFSSMVGKWKDASLVSVIVVVAVLAFATGMW